MRFLLGLSIAAAVAILVFQQELSQFDPRLVGAAWLACAAAFAAAGWRWWALRHSSATTSQAPERSGRSARSSRRAAAPAELPRQEEVMAKIDVYRAIARLFAITAVAAVLAGVAWLAGLPWPHALAVGAGVLPVYLARERIQRVLPWFRVHSRLPAALLLMAVAGVVAARMLPQAPAWQVAIVVAMAAMVGWLLLSRLIHALLFVLMLPLLLLIQAISGLTAAALWGLNPLFHLHLRVRHPEWIGDRRQPLVSLTRVVLSHWKGDGPQGEGRWLWRGSAGPAEPDTSPVPEAFRQTEPGGFTGDFPVPLPAATAPVAPPPLLSEDRWGDFPPIHGGPGAGASAAQKAVWPQVPGMAADAEVRIPRRRDAEIQSAEAAAASPPPVRPL